MHCGNQVLKNKKILELFEEALQYINTCTTWNIKKKYLR